MRKSLIFVCVATVLLAWQLITFEKDYSQCSRMDFHGNQADSKGLVSRFESYPNPANPLSVIKISINEEDLVSFKIFNVSGQLVRALIDGRLAPGEHSLLWDGRDDSGNSLSSGIYFCRFGVGNYNESKKIVLVR